MAPVSTVCEPCCPTHYALYSTVNYQRFVSKTNAAAAAAADDDDDDDVSVRMLDVYFVCCVCDMQRLQQDLQRETAQLTSSDVTMERVLNRDIVVTVNTTVLTAPTSSTAVSETVNSLFTTFSAC